jgi:deoxyribodipyrimidine photo-lyase
MNYAGCKRKFNVDAYISDVKKLVAQSGKRKAEESLNSEAKKFKSRGGLVQKGNNS